MIRLLRRLAILAGIGATYHLLLRPRMLSLGATPEEVKRELPGDEIPVGKPMRSTMAITIEAPPEAVWPWIVQQGWERGGFYSYNPIEITFGADLHNADGIVSDWQDLAVGDTVRMSHPRLDWALPETRVATLVPNRALVLEILPPQRIGGDTPAGAWSFVLEPLNEDRTRLLARLQLHVPKLSGSAFFYLLMEPVHFVMQRGGLRGIKHRAEWHRRHPVEAREPKLVATG